MDKATRMKNMVIGFLCLVVAALLGFNIYQHRRLVGISISEITETVSDVLSPDHTAPPGTDSITTEKTEPAAVATISQPDTDGIDALEAELDAMESELDAARRQMDDEMTREELLKEKQQELQRQYMESPAFRNNIRTTLDAQYEEILDEMNLSDEKREEFLDLVVDQQMAKSALYSEIETAVTDVQKEELRARNIAMREADEAALQDLLGSDWETYHDYVEMRTTRYFIDGFSASLASENQLTENQERELTEIMYNEQMTVFEEMGYDPRYEIEFPSDIKEGNVDGQASNMAKIQWASLEQSRDVLSESQYEQYESYLDNLQQITELSEQMSE